MPLMRVFETQSYNAGHISILMTPEQIAEMNRARDRQIGTILKTASGEAVGIPL